MARKRKRDEMLEKYSFLEDVGLPKKKSIAITKHLDEGKTLREAMIAVGYKPKAPFITKVEYFMLRSSKDEYTRED